MTFVWAFSIGRMFKRLIDRVRQCSAILITGMMSPALNKIFIKIMSPARKKYSLALMLFLFPIIHILIKLSMLLINIKTVITCLKTVIFITICMIDFKMAVIKMIKNRF